MFRKFVAISLFVSFVAMSTSGLMMFFINETSFTIQMHPVHKLFGLLLVAAACAHIFLNYRGLLNHLKKRTVAVFGALLVAVLVLLYGVAINQPIPEGIATQLNELAKQAEMQAESD